MPVAYAFRKALADFDSPRTRASGRPMKIVAPAMPPRTIVCRVDIAG